MKDYQDERTCIRCKRHIPCYPFRLSQCPVSALHVSHKSYTRLRVRMARLIQECESGMLCKNPPTPTRHNISALSKNCYRAQHSFILEVAEIKGLDIELLSIYGLLLKILAV